MNLENDNINFIRRALEENFSLNLQIDFKFSNQDKIIFDLADNERHFYVEVKQSIKSIDSSLIKQINYQKEYLKSLYPNEKTNHILVFQNSINSKVKKDLLIQLNNKGSKQYVFDREDIANMLGDESIKNYNNKENTNENNLKEVENKSFYNLKEIIGNVNYFVAGHSWGDQGDQMPRFIENKIWENGHDENDTNAVNSANKNDVIFMKSAFPKGKIGILRIKAIGLVTANKKDGHNLSVNWHRFQNYIDIEGLSQYRRTFARVSDHNINTILLEILKNNSNLINIITGLITTALSSKNNSDLKFEEKFKAHRFVRDVLNKEYDLNLVIETVGILNGISINLDLADEEAKSYAVVLNKKQFSNVANDSQFKAGNKDRIIMSKIYSEINNDINSMILESNYTLNKYFAFFDDSFTEENINNIKHSFKAFKSNALKILTLADIFKLAEKNDIKYSDYLPNNLESKIEEETKEELIIDNKQDKIPFHLDQVVDEDKLGREPVAKEFVRLIKNDIFTDKLNHSFMVHLQGKWGAGKSSFLNFIKNNLNEGEEDWIVVEYNAWQNQHISPPWWSLIDQVYLKSRKQLNKWNSFHLWRKETSRRIWRYSGWDKTIAFIIFLLCILCLIYFSNDVLNIFNASTSSDAGNTNKNFASNFGVFLKLILTSASVLGTLFTFTKFITVPFFINSSKEAKSFVLRASDPMNKIKDHFNKLVDDINSKKKKRQLAIFIDDIDRCDKEFIVQLLEGIQTLFKDKRVLYIVAGDKNWISTSFGNTYEDFATEQINKKQLGEFFIEKAFQLSFRLPNISEASKQNYWNHILGLKKEDTNIKINSVDELTEDEQYQLKEELEIAQSDLTDPLFVEELQEKYNLSEDTASNIVIEEKNKDTEKLKHLLQEYHTYIDTNPRSIIRLANNYTMARAILMTERANFNEHKLFRWLVIEDLCPNVKNTIATTQNISDLEDIINENNDIIKRNNSLQLLKGDDDFMEGAIEMEDIKTIKGI